MNNKTCGECKYFILDSSGFCKSNEGQEDSGNDCCSFFEPKVITNGDHVRRMGNEELAKCFAYPCPSGVKKKCSGDNNDECFDCWFNWLNSPAKSEGKMEELKPCPFCGGKPDVRKEYPINNHFPLNEQDVRKPIFYIGCVHCGISVSYNMEFWNTRPAEDALKAEVERLKEALSDIANIGFEGKVGNKVARETMRRIANSVSEEKGERG